MIYNNEHLAGNAKDPKTKAEYAQKAREDETSLAVGWAIGRSLGVLAGIFKYVALEVKKVITEGYDFWKVRNASPGNYTYWAYAGQEIGWYRYSEAKGLKLSLNISKEFQSLGLGSRVFSAGMASTKATKFTTTWVESSNYSDGASVNLIKYLKGIAQNMTPEEAAFSTWSGRQAKAHGFNKVEIEKISNGIQATFTK